MMIASSPTGPAHALLRRPAAATLSAQAPDPAQPPDEHLARTVLCGGRHAAGALPAVSCGKSQGRHCADDDGWVGDCLAGFAPGFRQPAGLQGRDRAASGPAGGRVPRARRGGDDPDHPYGPPHRRLVVGRLAAGAGPLADPRTGPPLVSQGGGRLGHRAHRRRLCRNRAAHAGGGHGWHRA